ncbi:MAG: c-type cytochrome [Kiloniellales bacterium]
MRNSMAKLAGATKAGLLVGLAGISLLAASVAPALAGDAAAGRTVAAVKCKQCHGLDGLGTTPLFPTLAGQSEEYLVKQLHDFRDGHRENEMMTFLAKDLSDPEIDNLAAYYASIPFEVKLPQ